MREYVRINEVLVACGFCRFEFTMGAFAFALGMYDGGIAGIHAEGLGWLVL